MTNQTVNTEQDRALRRAANIKRRNAAESRFRWYGRLSIGFGIACVLFLFTDIVGKGMGAFTQTYINMEITFDSDMLGLDTNSSEQEIRNASFGSFTKKTLRKKFPDVTSRKDKRDLYSLVSSDTPLILRDMVLENPSLMGTTQTISLIADDDVDVYYKHGFNKESEIGRVSELKKGIVAQLHEQGVIEKRFNRLFFSNSDSREPVYLIGDLVIVVSDCGSNRHLFRRICTTK